MIKSELADGAVNKSDLRFMAAAIRFSRRHTGRTGTNPSVATLIVDREGAIIGRGITALGGRPHAEAEALAEAGDRARGATAYVTLEPCAHHGKTPPCAETLLSAGIARLVAAATDPDPRVSGEGYDILRRGKIEVISQILSHEAEDAMSDYLIRSARKRPEVILKLAVSADGMIGKKGMGQVMVTGTTARSRVHLLRAQAHAIMIGSGTALADDPELTCRLPGMENRSPLRIVVGRAASLKPESKLLATLREVPVLLAPSGQQTIAEIAELEKAGVRILSTEKHEGRVALPELLEDLGAQGIMSVLLEGGAELARSFLQENLVDRIMLFVGTGQIGSSGINSPIQRGDTPAGFALAREEMLGEDQLFEWVRKERF